MTSDNPGGPAKARPPRDWPDPIPLVTFPPGGLYRDEMFERFERDRRRWYIGFTGSSLSSILVAVEAGMGISLLPLLTAQDRDVRIHGPLGQEPSMSVSLYAWEGVDRIARLVADMIALLAERRATL